MTSAVARPDVLPPKKHCLGRCLDIKRRILDGLDDIEGWLGEYVGRNGQTCDAMGELEGFAKTADAFVAEARVALNVREE